MEVKVYKRIIYVQDISFELQNVHYNVYYSVNIVRSYVKVAIIFCNSNLFVRYLSLDHVGMHSEQKPITSKISEQCLWCCGNQVIQLNVHTVDDLYQCNISDTNLIEIINLKYNQWANTREKPYQCSVCDKAPDEKSYQCDICDPKLKNRTHFEPHLNLHTGEKPFLLNFCETYQIEKMYKSAVVKQFNLGRNSKKIYCIKGLCSVYDRSFTREKPYQCNVCDTCFADKTNMEPHQILHTGEKTYKYSYSEIYQTEKYYMNAVSNLDLGRNINLIFKTKCNHVGYMKLWKNSNSLLL